MKITKFGHSCFLIEDKGVRVLFDPGNMSKAQNKVRNIDAIIITHKHSDHMCVESIKKIMANNKSAEIISNAQVAGILAEYDYKVKVVEEGENSKYDLKGMKIEAFGNDHVYIYTGIPTPQNTAYMINNKLFNTGDALINPPKKVDILIFIVTAPWIKLSEILDFIFDVKPRIAIPAHDGNMKDITDYLEKLTKILGDKGILLHNLEINKEYKL